MKFLNEKDKQYQVIVPTFFKVLRKLIIIELMILVWYSFMRIRLLFS